MNSRKQFEDVYKKINPLTSTRETAWLCWQAGRASMRDESTQALQARYMGDNNREDAEVKRCIDSVKAIQP